ncbi:hypothetical protein R1flu_005631 [Riccia fluitans]|uniref:Resistance to phytophthora 1 n=1 Tax=Riccia fluitans TaxID=41844 RepID=A0ABD1YWP7_9MARC
MAMAAVPAAAVSSVNPSLPSSHRWDLVLRRYCYHSSKVPLSHGERQLRLLSTGQSSTSRDGRNFARASSQQKTEIETQQEEGKEIGDNGNGKQEPASAQKSSTSQDIQKELNKAVSKTAATFAPRASTASKNPAVPGSTLYQIFEAQGYITMAVGGLLSYNILFPSDHADIWRLMGMWSVWMFTIPSLRARDCSKKEKEALNYLFLLVPLINVTLPIFWKSFAAVWSADVVAFFTMYAWKMEWLSDSKKADD